MSKTKKAKCKKIARPGRRTRDEISIGMTVDEKKAGMTYTQKLEGKTVSDLKSPVRKKPAIKTSEKVNKTKEPVVKTETVILKNGKTVQEVLNNELERCSWDWKYIKIDKNFKLEGLTKLGREGWKFAFVHEPKILDPNSKKPSTICMQRPAKKGK